MLLWKMKFNIDKTTEIDRIQYPCDQCQFAAAPIPNFKNYKERVKFPCDQCDYATSMVYI